MINIVAFVVAAGVYLFTWGLGVHGLTAALIPALILISAAAIDTYLPLIKKTIHGE
ncbi:MAG: hypothetical protein ACRDKI_11010 [Solirubrobacterales bacterium]